MTTLQYAIDQLSAVPPELRRSMIAKIGAEALGEAWRSCADATVLAHAACLVLPRGVVAWGLAACVRYLLSQQDFGKPALTTVVAVLERSASNQGSREEADAAIDTLGACPPSGDLAYNAYAALVNLHKFLFIDVKGGIEGVVFFCAEGTLSKECQTWEKAMGRIADRFRGAVPDPFVDTPSSHNPDAK